MRKRSRRPAVGKLATKTEINATQFSRSNNTKEFCQMVPISTLRRLIVGLVTAFSCALLGCSLGSDGLTESALTERLAQETEQTRLDNQRLAGLGGGLAHSLQPSAYAASSDDTLANLLFNGETVFPALSAALRRDNLGADLSANHAALGAAYVKSVAGDGQGGLYFIFVVDGRESPVHFSADQFHPGGFFQGVSEGSLTAYSLGSWTGSFDDDPEAPSTTRLTRGSSIYDYVDLNGWGIGSVNYIGLRGYSAYGARTLPENLRGGRATYAGGVWADWWDADDPRSSGQTLLRGTLRLETDFNEREVSGRIGALRIRAAGATSYAELSNESSIVISSTPIDKARFAADWVASARSGITTPRQTIHGFEGTIIGEFYGPGAQEIGGVLSGRRGATDTTPEQFLIGGFVGSQPDSGP